jgi:hypothetical protein
MNWCLKLFIVLAIAYGSCVALPPPDNSYKGSVQTNQRVVAYMNDVDDVGLVLLWNANGVKTVDICQWQSGGIHGNSKKNITPYLTKGDNYLVYVLYNKVYVGFGIFAGGKYSYDFSLDIDGAEIWRKSDYVSNNTKGIKYWKVIKINVSNAGKITASDDIPQKIINSLNNGLESLENKLDVEADIAVPF